MKKGICKKIITLIITITMIMSNSVIIFGETIKSEDVTDTYIKIYTPEDLNNIRNNLDGKYVLMNDIDFSQDDFVIDGKFYNDGYGWQPVGIDEKLSFTGIFDGNGHTIRGLFVKTDQKYAGLFGYSKGIIKNLKVEDSNISSTYQDCYVGDIVGYNEGTIIDDSHSEEYENGDISDEIEEDEKTLGNSSDEEFTDEGNIIPISEAQNMYANSNSVRIAGENRYQTAMSVADALKEHLNVKKFDNIIVASGLDYADGISATYLAKIKKAPILLVEGELGLSTKDYINANLNADGTVYIIGGTGAVSKKFENSISQYNVERFGGKDRFETNRIILENVNAAEAEEFIICTAYDFADGLSASAVGKPIMLVDKQLGEVQKKYLQQSNIKNYYLIGGTGAISNTVEKQLMAYGDIYRLNGRNRFQTCELIAKQFFKENCQSMVLAYGMDFPDGLVGGTLAMATDSPLILVNNSNYGHAVQLKNEKGIKKVIVLGGPKLISGPLAPEKKQGIDVSAFQENINWKSVKDDGVEFAMIRVGGRFGASGSIYDDAYFHENMKGALNNGIDVGVYFYTQAVTVQEAIEEARYTCSKLKEYNVRYPVTIDTEYLEGGRHSSISIEQRTEVVKAFCDEVRRQGYTPMIYSNLNWLNHNLNMSRLAQYNLWVAQYNDTCDYNGNYNCWQYTSNGRVNGIQGNVDLNIWY